MTRDMWTDRGRAIATAGASRDTLDRLAGELAATIDPDRTTETSEIDDRVARYLLAELVRPEGFSFAQTSRAADQVAAMRRDKAFKSVLAAASDDVVGILPVIADAVQRAMPGERHVVPEVAVALAIPDLERRTVDVDLDFTVAGLNGRHPSITDGTLTGRIDELLDHVAQHRATVDRPDLPAPDRRQPGSPDRHG